MPRSGGNVIDILEFAKVRIDDLCDKADRAEQNGYQSLAEMFSFGAEQWEEVREILLHRDK